MKRQPKHILKAVRVLTDPDPRFASLVQHGANQTPFLKLASDEDGNITVEKSTQMEEDSMSKTEVRQRSRTATKADNANAQVPEVHKMTFPVAHYADEAAVKTYLINHGYDADTLTISGKGEHYEVMGHAEDKFASDLQTIELDNVTLTVGLLSEEAVKELEDGQKAEKESGGKADAQPVGDAAKAEEVSQDEAEAGDSDNAGSEASAKDSDGGEVTDAEPGDVISSGEPEVDAELDAFLGALGVVKSFVDEGKEATAKFEDLDAVIQYMDDVPPGFYDIVNAFAVVSRSAFRDKEYGKIRKAARDMGEYAISLATIFETAEKSDATDEQKATALRAAAALANVFPAAKDDEAEDDAPVEAAKADTTEEEVATSEAPEGTPAEATTEKSTEAGAEDAPAETPTLDIGAQFADALKTALAPVAEAVKQVGEAVDAVKQTQKETEERVAQLETPEQTRKGEDVDASTPAKEKSWKYDDLVGGDKLTRDLIGLR